MIKNKVLSRLSFLWSIGFGLGQLPFAPGTFGTLLAIPLCWFGSFLGLFWHIVFWLVLLVLSIISSSNTANELKLKDPGCIVCDEVVGFWLVLLVVPWQIYWVICAFLLFRLFDIFKPWPINLIDKSNSGWSIVADDLAAALFVVLIYSIYCVI